MPATAHAAVDDAKTFAVTGVDENRPVALMVLLRSTINIDDVLGRYLVFCLHACIPA